MDKSVLQRTTIISSLVCSLVFVVTNVTASSAKPGETLNHICWWIIQGKVSLFARLQPVGAGRFWRWFCILVLRPVWQTCTKLHLWALTSPGARDRQIGILGERDPFFSHLKWKNKKIKKISAEKWEWWDPRCRHRYISAAKKGRPKSVGAVAAFSLTKSAGQKYIVLSFSQLAAWQYSPAPFDIWGDKWVRNFPQKIHSAA